MFPLGLNHKVTTKLIYATAILHNMFIVHRDDKIDIVDNHIHWAKFFDEYKADLCPSCVSGGKNVCVHMASYRNGAAQTRSARRSPSSLRDEICGRLWEEVLNLGAREASEIRKSMEARAQSKDFY